MFYSHLKGHIEALLFANGDAITASKIAQILNIPDEHAVLLLEELVQEMNEDNRGLTIVEVAGGYQLCTKPGLAPVVEKLAALQETRLSMAAMETLAIVAFKQPVTKQEIENIRGVKVDGIVNMLVERSLIKEMGRKEAIGRPILYGTTGEFLKCFGLKSLHDLPPLADFLTEQQPN